MRWRYAAVSDVGRVRKENQDSGYAGPWLLAVCDGVGGAVRGDLASATALNQIRKLDVQPPEELLGAVAGAIHRAHDRIQELVEEQPALTGTSTTATVALFDGEKLGIGHLGDSRAYLFRDGALQQLTRDHTFVQSLVDEGRISDEEARTHPHRNLILKALDGTSAAEPDLFEVPVQEGDVVLICSDGASGALTDGRMGDILSSGTPDYAAVELVRAAIEAGSSDNVTAVVAQVTDEEVLEPGTLVVGAAAEVDRPVRRGFRGHRAGDTGEIAAVRDPVVDPEAVRYAPRPPMGRIWLRRLFVLVGLLGLLWIGAAGAYAWSQHQFYVGISDNKVAIFRGINQQVPLVQMSHVYETTDLDITKLDPTTLAKLRDGIDVTDLDAAHETVDNAAKQAVP